jgi:hypothetical protein
MLPQITEIILIEEPLIGAEMKLRQKHFSGVGREYAAAQRLVANHETTEMKIAPIECDLEKVVQDGDAAVAARGQTPNWLVDLEEQDMELV